MTVFLVGFIAGALTASLIAQDRIRRHREALYYALYQIDATWQAAETAVDKTRRWRDVAFQLAFRRNTP